MIALTSRYSCDTEAQHEHRGLRGDGHDDLVGERESLRRLPVLVAKEPVARGLEHLALAIVERAPQRDARFDDRVPTVGQSFAAVQHDG